MPTLDELADRLLKVLARRTAARIIRTDGSLDESYESLLALLRNVGPGTQPGKASPGR
jgi:hypothetical protein